VPCWPVPHPHLTLPHARLAHCPALPGKKHRQRMPLGHAAISSRLVTLGGGSEVWVWALRTGPASGHKYSRKFLWAWPLLVLSA
jgi:hypothetical protein